MRLVQKMENLSKIKISRENDGRLSASSVVLGSRSDHVITVGGENGASAVRLLEQELSRLDARVLSLFIFGGTPGDGGMSRLLPAGEFGTSWLHGDCRDGGLTSAVQVFAHSGGAPVHVIRRGSAVGVVYEDDTGRYCRLASVVPRHLNGTREQQTREVFESAEAMLREGGFRFTDTIRTWFYLDRLLDWYGVFNAVRTDFFRTRGVFEKLVPASTGIGAGNAFGAALTCDLLAVQPKAGTWVSEVRSPLQDSAMEYKSSFSRAVEIASPGCRQLLVSGTASIDKTGRTIHVGDSAAQIETTMQVIGELIQSRGMGWADVTRGIAYFKNLADRPMLENWLAQHAVQAFPLAMAAADVCRDDLLFELEVDAVRLSATP